MQEGGLRSGDPHQQVPEPSGGLAWTILPALGAGAFAWTFRNAPEGQTNRSTFSQENNSLGVRSSSLFIWRAVFAAWQRGHYFRGSILPRQLVRAPRFCSLGSAFIIAAAGCV